MSQGSSPAERLRWLRRRARAISPEELPYRVQQAGQKLADGLRPLPEPAACPIAAAWPRIEPSWAASDALREAARRIVAGELTLLGVRWPEGPVDWDVDPISGHRWPSTAHGHAISYREPGVDPNLVWELHRLRHLQVLALGARLGGVPGARDLALSELRSWLARPPYLGMAWASGIECAQRVVSLLVVRACLDLPPEVEARLGQQLVAHGRWLARYPSLYSSANNHRLAELVGLVACSACLPAHPEAEEWRAAAAELRELAEKLWHQDGGYVEQTLTYQAAATEWLLVARGVTTGLDWAPQLDDILARSAAFLAHVLDDSGLWPPIGDDDGSVVVEDGEGREQYPSSVVHAVASALGRPELAPPSPESLRSLVLGGGALALGPPRPPCTFVDAGLTVLRSARFTAWLDHGPVGLAPLCAHGHADQLAVWATVDGQPLLWGLGTYQYADDAWREFQRSSRAHNTVVVDGQAASEPSGGFTWNRTGECRLVASNPGAGWAEAEQSHRGLRVARRITLSDATLTVVDRLDGAGTHTATWWFHLHPAVRAEADGRRVHLAVGDATWTLTVPDGATPTLFRGGAAHGPGWASPAYNTLVPTTSIRVQARYQGGHSFEHTIAPTVGASPRTRE
ncbi:MAG: hypothetical protein EP330_05795 [Deltaproteobacteria bacterium]|nr:MAG: hypothetical protein EP330_05795 [Deltaproteobacteria bacterium]